MTSTEYRSYIMGLKALALPRAQHAHERILRRQSKRLALDAGKTMASVAAAAGLGLFGAWLMSQKKPVLLAKK